MHILPVIDLLGGAVVRGVGGKREEYRPIQSALTTESTPAAIAQAFVGQFGFRDVYIADLDAIAGAPPAWADYEAVAATGLKLWVDAGVADAQRAVELAERMFDNQPLDRIILGLESLQNIQSLREIVAAVGARRLVFSLDLRDGRPVTSASGLATSSPLQIAAMAHAAGVRQMIVLDLTRVGVGEGTGTEVFVNQLRREFHDLQLIGGGGVRGLDDVTRLAQLGLSRVLVASAIHDGRITRNV